MTNIHSNTLPNHLKATSDLISGLKTNEEKWGFLKTMNKTAQTDFTKLVYQLKLYKKVVDVMFKSLNPSITEEILGPYQTLYKGINLY